MHSRHHPLRFVDAAWSSVTRRGDSPNFAGIANRAFAAEFASTVSESTADDGDSHTAHNFEA
jgi:hypothetical protein